MKLFFNTLMVTVASLTLSLGVINTAEAKKGFSGGGSFGSKFSQNKSVKRDSATSGKQNATPAQQTNADRKQQLAKKGGIAGMLGMLAMGGLLGALFFGGAFENINFMDILIFGLIAFVLFKIFSSRAKAGQQNRPAAASGYGDMEMTPDNNPNQQRENMAGAFGGGHAETASEDGLDTLRTGIDKGFDADEFINGAKSCFERLQRAWSEGDMADVRQFTSDHVFVEIQDRHRQRDGKSDIEVVSLNAELLSAHNLGSKQEASVFFQAELLEDGERVQVEEVWHFTRPSNSTQPTWFLDGIQQVED